MNINHSAEYIALWKSHKRTEWEAERLEEQVSGLLKNGKAVVEWASTLAGGRAAGQLSAGGHAGTFGDADEDEVRRLQQESRRMWQLRSEIGAELEQVAETLTPGQRRSAEKMLKQWEREASRG